MSLLRFKTELEAKEHFRLSVYPQTPPDEVYDFETMFTDWVDSTEMIIEELNDNSDWYDEQTHHAQ